MTYTDPAGYQGYMGRWSARLAPLFVAFADPPDDGDVLDVGCGTGNLTLAIADARPGARITGVDPSADFIAHARTRRDDARLKFEVGDAQELPFPDESFDACLAQLVLQMVPDRPRALAEMRRVTRPGSRIATCLWDFVSGMEMISLFWEAAVAVDPTAAEQHKRPGRLRSRDEFAALLTDAGLVAVESTVLTLPLEFSGLEDYWQPFLVGATPSSAYAASLPADHQAAIREWLRNRLLGDGPDRPFTLQAHAWAVCGGVPE